MVWVFWGAVGGVLAVLLLWAWWLDRNARRRGAGLRAAGEMDRDRRLRNRAVEREISQVTAIGMNPRAHDAARRIWRGDGTG